jgi:hypothetical protein
MKFRIPVLACERQSDIGMHYTHVEVCVNYWRSCKSAYVYVQPIKVRDGMVSLELFSGQRVHLERMERLNRKRIDALGEVVKAQIADKQGPVWDALEKVRAAHGLTLADFRYSACEVC